MNSEPKTQEEIAQRQKMETQRRTVLVLVSVIYFCGIGLGLSTLIQRHPQMITIVSMDFTVELNNTQQTHNHHLPLTSARWDLLTRLPEELVGNDICLHGNLQASFLYKNVTLVTSSIQSYNKLELGVPRILNVSAVATEEDLGNSIGKEIMEAIKERKEVRFGTQLSLTDCREDTKKGTMSYACNETTLRFEPARSTDQIMAALFGNHATCIAIL